MSSEMQYVLCAPSIYAIELTPECNNRCLGCFNVFGDASFPVHRLRTPPPLDADRWNRILKKIAPYAQAVKITGGEPTFHPQFERIITNLSGLGIEFAVLTNGRWRQPARLLAFLEEQPRFCGLLISLHGPDAATHESFAGVRGAFEETVHNIELAVSRGISVATSTVITRSNHAVLKETVDLVLQLGADHAVINRYLGSGQLEVEPTYEQLRDAIATVEAMIHRQVKVKFGNCIPFCFAENSSSGCLAGVAYCAIDPWGNLRPCTHSPTILGSLLHDSLKTLWRSSAMDHWRELTPVECGSCALYARCHGGCRAAIELRADGVDPLRGSPLSVEDLRTEAIRFGAELRPVGRYHVRKEKFGYVLMRGSRIAPVASVDMSIVALFDGSHTLGDIEVKTGIRGLRLVAGLRQMGLLEWAT